MKEHYIKAMVATLTAGERAEFDVVLKNLVTTLKKRGHAQLLPAILSGVVAELGRETTKKPVLVVAGGAKSAYTKYKQELASYAAELGIDLSSEDNVTIEENETIIGGFTLTTENQKVDRSYKTRLLNFYRSITA